MATAAARPWLPACVAFACVTSAIAARASRSLHLHGGEPSGLSEAELRRCSFEVVMLDTRELTDEPSFMGALVPDQYVSITAALNFAYARRFGYNYTFVRVDKTRLLRNFSAPWHRVFYFAERLARLPPAPAPCRWFLYVDSDAFVRAPSTPLPSFLAGLASRYRMQEDVGAIFAQEQAHPPEMPRTLHAVNAGVYLVQANERSRHLFREWARAASDDRQLEVEWPAEQGVLTEMRFPGRYYTRLRKKHARLRKHDDISGDMALVNMTEMNSPWGRFVEHVWSGPGSELRASAYTDALAAIGASDAGGFSRLLAEARARSVDWAPREPA